MMSVGSWNSTTETHLASRKLFELPFLLLFWSKRWRQKRHFEMSWPLWKYISLNALISRHLNSLFNRKNQRNNFNKMQTLTSDLQVKKKIRCTNPETPKERLFISNWWYVHLKGDNSIPIWFIQWDLSGSTHFPIRFWPRSMLSSFLRIEVHYLLTGEARRKVLLLVSLYK